eukprot:CAMPEP_0202015266 /NCGR_PEP_ID=MMETSP0905-20130828/31536_1 /ASSEMBLY_ACC=CAM_ASM_000554 /TAXON_ID=420261 /ORGANISM="Thalassiosira antarctica, Strain CCMP982" /LENGTH=353 /DNA_ID=CAMNT_0048575381 /DNA_START=42 /DNA_END=1099 /DNA_ORIENTATION=+
MINIFCPKRNPAVIVIVLIATTVAFTVQPNSHQRLHRLDSSPQPPDENLSVIGVVAPLKYVGPYACLELDFPHLTTEAQKDASINFVLDTGANVNSISKDLAKSLNLPLIVRKEDLSVLGSAGAGGSFQAGDIVMLGDCQLGGMPEGQKNITFMRNLTAASLDLGIASSVGGELLGTSFFACFPAGVEFDFYGTDGDPPSMIFYYGQTLPEDAKENAFCVSLEESFWGVPSITVNINGINLRAIIDTGSPITIISPNAAGEVGVGRQKSKQEEGSFLKIKGIDNETVDLSRSLSGASISIGNISFGNLETICIGDLPGLSLASDLSSTPDPQFQVLLGLDVLRRMYRMILRLP